MEPIIKNLGLTRSQLVECLQQCNRQDIADYCQVSLRTLDRIVHDYQLGRKNYGPKRLSKQIVNDIRMLYEDRAMTQQELANRYNVSQSTISKIINRQTHQRSCDFKISGNANVRRG